MLKREATYQCMTRKMKKKEGIVVIYLEFLLVKKEKSQEDEKRYKELPLWHNGIGSGLEDLRWRFIPWPGTVEAAWLWLSLQLWLESDPWPRHSICRGICRGAANKKRCKILLRN